MTIDDDILGFILFLSIMLLISFIIWLPLGLYLSAVAGALIICNLVVNESE